MIQPEQFGPSSDANACSQSLGTSGAERLVILTIPFSDLDFEAVEGLEGKIIVMADQPLSDIYDNNPASFRLLKISRFKEERVCELKSFQIGEGPKYSALSYTWGPPLSTGCDDDYTRSDARSITLQTARGERPCFIGRNLFEGLCNLAELEHLAPEYLWVDAICINQTDTNEKSIQVPLMGTIYASAERVIVWLGKYEVHLDDFRWVHEVFYPALERYAEVHGVQSAMQPDWTIYNASARLPIEIREDRWKSYCKFLEDNRWFHRAWIVQEIALARRITLLCGNSILPWDDMVALASIIRINGLGTNLEYLRTGTTLQPSRPLGDEVQRLGSFRGLVSRGLEEPGFRKQLTILGGLHHGRDQLLAFFIFALQAIRMFEASEPHDKVYAALGILEFLGQGQSGIALKPKYKLGVEEVYQEVTFYLVQNLPQLAILSCVEDKSHRGSLNLPSWVPDFTFRSPSTNLLFFRDNWNASPAGNASSNEKTLLGSTLKLKGVCFDIIEETVTDDGPAPLAEGVINAIRWLEQLFDLCDRTNAFEPYQEHIIVSLAKTLVCSRCGPMLPVTEGEVEDSEERRDINSIFHSEETTQFFRSWALMLLAVCSFTEAALPAYKKCIEALGRLAEKDSEVNSILFTESDILKAATGIRSLNSTLEYTKLIQQHSEYDAKVGIARGDQKVYRTSNGYVGLGPTSVEPGDQVWLICDARVPFILHPSCEAMKQFTLMGETYLHGCMFGERLTQEIEQRLDAVYLI